MKVTLRPYQEQILDKVKPLASFGLFMETGTGKTITSLTRATNNPTNNLLIVCPHSVIEQWEATINKFFPKFKVFKFNKSTTATRKNKDILNMGDSNTIIINFDILYKMNNLLNIVDDDWTIIIDESHRIKTPPKIDRRNSKITGGKTSYAALELGKLTPYKMILTATPTQGDFGGYVDYYTQLSFLGYLDMSYSDFEYRYIRHTNIKVPNSPFPVKKIIGYKNTEEIDNILKLCCVYYSHKFGDFEPQHIKVEFEQPKNYKTVDRTRIYEKIVMQNSSRKRIGLKTLCTGNITGMDYYNERYVYEDNTLKIDWLREFLEDTNKVIAIYYNYNVELEALEKLMKKLGKTYIVINGKTKNKYSEINDKEYDVMLGQYQAASESLDGLQYKCHIQVLFALPESSIKYKQTIGRIDRDGQTKVPIYYYLVCKQTIEEKIYNMIERKVDFSEETLNQLVLDFDEKNINESEDIF